MTRSCSMIGQSTMVGLKIAWLYGPTPLARVVDRGLNLKYSSWMTSTNFLLDASASSRPQLWVRLDFAADEVQQLKLNQMPPAVGHGIQMPRRGNR